MEAMKPVVGSDFSINHEATVKNAEGVTVSAKDVLCAEAPAVLLGLDAASALSKNFIVKMCIGIVKSGVEALVLAFCTAP